MSFRISGWRSGDPHLQGRRLAVGEQLLVHLDLDLGDHLLDAPGVDAAVGDQALQGQPGDLPAHRLEAREDHRLGGVVDDQVDAGGLLEGADVAPLAADDASLHLVRRQVDHRHRALHHVVGGDPLDRHRDHPRAFSLAFSEASSSIRLTRLAASIRASFSIACSSSCLACSTVSGRRSARA
jgi:hypothetical protein